MPAPQLVSALLEQGLNGLLSLDDASAQRIAKLKGKRLVVSLAELPGDLLFVFSTSVDVLVLERQPTEADRHTRSESDCYLETSLFTLPELQNISNITQLIKQDKLLLEGDIQIAQQFSYLLKALDIDWEEQVSRHTGDVLAHEIFQFADRVRQGLQGFKRRLDSTVKDAAIEEKRLVAPAPLVDEFSSQVSELQQRTQQLQRRLEQLQRKEQGS
ncbi:ubiquinone biosynthesis accessory factor UbiJ [Planctobacterium marinum]|uniref:ubiquinone biosynthesis accessory factor UbiJ n=1 Tax=Planctobacterium marinum TaxID=1631968 RepID=UPI001E61DCC8|nr:SCP2 sterol-binding domain-containing protein [Planctobacterium marinum]MCC2607071.1 SCP2 sterol-binding domain-containing protein [Planctobacterium marinum]